ncbi:MULTISPECIES: hypothetical protein [Photobacterium]|nr:MULTISPECIES: hypothetical protein [Photobacterium]
MPVYLTQEDVQNLVKTIKHVMIVLSFVLLLLGWMGNYFVSKYDASDLRSQETSKAMAVAETKIDQLSTTVSTLESENSELKKVQASQHERILKLEFQVQQSLKKQ